MRTYAVTLPIAGHAYVVVDAEDEKDAIEQALNTVELKHIETWEALEQFQQGNVSYCPRPWQIEVVDETPDDEESQP